MSTLAGLIFALGLGLGGMTQPHRVVGFLDIFGAWDPTLVFVLAGAVLTYGIGFRWIARRTASLHAASLDVPQLHLPTSRDITPALVVGMAMFGVGWALAGFCPGPALVSLVTLDASALTFVGTMVAGMRLHAWWQRSKERKT